MKFLVFQHVAHEHPGLIKKWADEKGIALDVMELWPTSPAKRGEKPYKIPNPLEYDGLIIMGGPMGVYENYPAEKEEIEIIKNALGTIPIVGFCLGAQLLAYTLGAKVYPNIKNGKRIKEVGYYDVKLTEDGKSDPILKAFESPIKVFQWHGDAFDLPDGAKLLATNANCTNQAFVYGDKAYGFLFHFEFTPEMIEKLIEVDKDWMHKDFHMDEEKLKRQTNENTTLMKSQCYRLFDNFIEVVS